MNKEITNGLVLKFSVAIICLTFIVLIFKFGMNTQQEEILKREMDSIDAYMKHWYNVVDTNGNGIPDLDEKLNLNENE